MPLPDHDHDLIENYRRQNRRVLFVLLGAVGVGLIVIVGLLWPAAAPPTRVVAQPSAEAFRIVAPAAPPTVGEPTTIAVEVTAGHVPDRLALVVDGRTVDTRDAAPWSFGWTPGRIGEHRLAVAHDGREGSTAVVMVQPRSTASASPVRGEPTPQSPRPSSSPAPRATASPPGSVRLADPAFADARKWKGWHRGTAQFRTAGGSGQPATWGRHEVDRGGRFFTYQVVNLAAGSYRLSARARTSGGIGDFQLEMKRDKSVPEVRVVAEYISPMPDWTEITLLSGPAEAGTYHIGISTQAPADGSGWSEFTDLRLERLP